MSNRTADGLRDRLFDTLDALIEKKIGKNEVESVCYISEQIIKTAQIELEFSREFNNSKERERQHELAMKREEKESIKQLQLTAGKVNDI